MTFWCRKLASILWRFPQTSESTQKTLRVFSSIPWMARAWPESNLEKTTERRSTASQRLGGLWRTEPFHEEVKELASVGISLPCFWSTHAWGSTVQAHIKEYLVVYWRIQRRLRPRRIEDSCQGCQHIVRQILIKEGRCSSLLDGTALQIKTVSLRVRGKAVQWHFEHSSKTQKLSTTPLPGRCRRSVCAFISRALSILFAFQQMQLQIAKIYEGPAERICYFNIPLANSWDNLRISRGPSSARLVQMEVLFWKLRWELCIWESQWGKQPQNERWDCLNLARPEACPASLI